MLVRKINGKDYKVLRPFRKQRDAYQVVKNNLITLYGGAIRGGKTYFLIYVAFTFAIKYPKSRWLFLRESMPTLKRTLWVTFQNLLQDYFKPYIADINEQTMTVTFKNGSQFVFMAESYDSDKELNRFKGLEINGAFIDEANEIREVTFDKVIERAGSWFHCPGCPIKIVMSANPSNNWLKQRIYVPWKNGTLPAGMAYVPSKIFDNPTVPKEFLDKLKLLPRFQYMVFVMGDWDVQLKVGGEFYKCFELDQHVRKTQYDPSLPLHISWDDNVNPYLPLGIFQIFIERATNPHGIEYIVRKEVRMVAEIMGVSPNNKIEKVCDEFKRLFPAHRAGLFVYCDATAEKEDTKLEKGQSFSRIIMDNLREYKPTRRVPKANPSVKMRGQWINTVLEKNIGKIYVQIGQDCTTTINDFILLKEDSNGGKNKEMETNEKTKVRFQVVGHFTDLFDYFMCAAFGADYETYQKGDTVLKPMVGKNKSKNTM